MTRAEAVTLIQRQLAFRTNLEDEIIAELQAAQIQLEAEAIKPWFLVSEDSYIDTTSDEQRVAVPSDFIEEVDEAVLRYVPDDVSGDDPEIDLIKGDYDELRKTYSDEDTGTVEAGAPEAYALLGNYFRIFPTPDDTYTLHMIYYKQDTTLSTNVENNWLKYVPYLLMGVAGQQIAGGPLRDKDAFAIFQSWEAKGRDALMRKNTSRDVANRNLQIGGPH